MRQSLSNQTTGATLGDGKREASDRQTASDDFFHLFAAKREHRISQFLFNLQ